MKLTELEKYAIILSRNFTCDLINGKVYNKNKIECSYRSKEGYIIISFWYRGKSYCLRAHRFLFFMKHGYLPYEVDHINGIRDDNRLENLREATDLMNAQNRLNCKGYYWQKKIKKWEARIKEAKGRNLYLGHFDREEDAREAYLQAKKKYHII